MGGWGLGAINTCVILLLPQSVNSMRRGGGKGAMIGTESQKLVWYASSIQERHLPLESSSSCTSCTTCTSTTALLLCIQQRHCPLKTCPQCLCLSMPCSSSLLLKSAIFSFEWHLRQGLAAFLDSKTCVLQVLHLCIFICLKCLASVDFHLPAYNILGQTFPGWQVRPRKLSCVLTSFARANLFLQLLQLKCTIRTIAHLPDDAHVRTLFPLAIVGWKYSQMAGMHYKCDTLWQFDSHTSLLVSAYLSPIAC